MPGTSRLAASASARSPRGQKALFTAQPMTTIQPVGHLGPRRLNRHLSRWHALLGPKAGSRLFPRAIMTLQFWEYAGLPCHGATAAGKV
jgi:hypothetical protein